MPEALPLPLALVPPEIIGGESLGAIAGPRLPGVFRTHGGHVALPVIGGVTVDVMNGRRHGLADATHLPVGHEHPSPDVTWGQFTSLLHTEHIH